MPRKDVHWQLEAAILHKITPMTDALDRYEETYKGKHHRNHNIQEVLRLALLFSLNREYTFKELLFSGLFHLWLDNMVSEGKANLQNIDTTELERIRKLWNKQTLFLEKGELHGEEET